MKMTRYSEPQILAILRQAEGGVPVAELCREHGMSTASFYKWRAKYGGMDASMIAQTKALEDENRRCQRQSKSEPKGSAKCCHFGVGEIAA
jgi:putative transposase